MEKSKNNGLSNLVAYGVVILVFCVLAAAVIRFCRWILGV